MEETLDQTDSIRELAVNRSQHQPDIPEAPVAPMVPGYRFEELLGTGSFGQVWAARQLRTGLEVAVKIFTRPAGLDWDYLRQEVSRLSRVAEHPNVVSLLDAGLDQVPPFFVMRRYGGSLSDWRRDHPDAPAQPILGWWKEIARALAYTHSKGLLHCDMKPSNVLLDAENRAILGDFGQSVARGTGGTHFGSLGYMAPEQAGQLEEGFGTPDVRWDIYGLGATIYFLLTGQLPRLPKDTLQQIGSLVGTAEKLSRYRFELAQRPLTPVRRLRPDMDGELAHLLESCLALNPAHRPQSAADVLVDLERCRQGQPLFCRRPWSAGYRATRFLRRNLVPVALTAIIAGGSLCAAGERWVEQTSLQAQGDFEKGLRDLNDGRAGSAAHRWARSLQIQPRQSAPAWLASFEPARLEFLRGVGDSLNRVGFSADGNLLFASGEKGTQVFDLRTNEPRGPRLGGTNPRGSMDVRPAYQDNPPSSFLLPGDRLLTLTDRSQMWDLASGAELPMKLPTATRVSCSDDGTKMLFLLNDGVVLVDAATGAQRRLESSFKPRRATMSADGKSVAVGSDLGAVELLLPQRKVLGHHDEPVEMLVFSPDGKRLASSTTDHPPVFLWDVGTGEHKTYQVGSWGIYGLSFSPDGQHLAASFYDGATGLWPLGGGEPKVLRHHWLNYGAKFSPDGKYLATYSVDGTARVWETATGRPVSPFLEHGSPVKAVAFRPGPGIQDGLDVATACEDGTLRLFRVSLRSEPIAFQRPGRGYQAKYSPDGTRLAVARTAADRSGCLVLYDTTDPSKAPALLSSLDLESGCHEIVWSPDGNQVVGGCESGEVAICSAAGKLQRILPHPKGIQALEMSPDGKLLATACADGRARLFQVVDGKLVREIAPAGNEPMLSVTFSPDGARLLTARDNHADLWQVADGTRLLGFEHNGVIRAATFSPDGSLIATASLDKSARVWNATTGQPASALLHHDLSVVNVHFSPDGKLLATASADGIGRLWNVKTGNLAAPGMRQRGPVWNTVFSPDGKLVATCSKTGTVQVYDLQGRPVLAPITHGDFAYSVSFRPDGKALATSSWDGTVQWRELRAPRVSNVGELTRQVEKRTGLRLEVQMGQCVIRALSPDEWARL